MTPTARHRAARDYRAAAGFLRTLSDLEALPELDDPDANDLCACLPFNPSTGAQDHDA